MGSAKNFKKLGSTPSDYFKQGAKVKVVKKTNASNDQDKEITQSDKPRVNKPFNKSDNGNGQFKKDFKPKPGFKPRNNNGKFHKNKDGGKGPGKFSKPKKTYIQKRAGNKGVGFKSSNYNDVKKGKAVPKGLDIHRWMNAHDGLQTPRNILKVTIAQALATITRIDNQVEEYINYLNVTTPKKENKAEYYQKLHSLIDLQNRRKGIASVIHKQNALVTIDFDFMGVKYQQTIDMLVLTIREMKKMLGIMSKDPKSKTLNKTNPFYTTKKQMVALLESLTEKLTEYNKVTTIEIPR